MDSSILLACGWLYTGAILLWWILLHLYGDTLWWVALVTPFAPLFFLPAVLLLFGALFIATYFYLPLLLLALLFALLYGAYFWPNKKSSPRVARVHNNTNPQIKVGTTAFTAMTFNCWWMSSECSTTKVLFGNSLPSEILESCSDTLPDRQEVDLVALQELQPEMVTKLSTEVGHLYPHRIVDVSGTMPQRLGILSRFPLISLDATHLQAPNFRIQIARVSLPTSSFLLYNIHPRATNILRYLDTPKAFVNRVRQSFYEREKFFRCLLDDIAKREEPTLVMGDFNSTDLSDVYRLMSHELTDAHRSAGRGFGFTFPTHGADFKGLPLPRRFMRLDMIFYSKGLLALQCQVGQTHGESDHLPVLAKFTQI